MSVHHSPSPVEDHKRNFHARNHGLPIWDTAFGTFDCRGFKPEVEYRVMMRKVDA